MSATTSTLQIPQDVLQPIINAHVAAAITEALGNRSQLIEEVVRQTLTANVDSDGRPTTYGGHDFLRWLVNKAIREAVTNAVHDQIGNDLEHIKAIVAKEIKNQRSPLVKQLIEGIARAASGDAKYRVKVVVEGDEVLAR